MQLWVKDLPWNWKLCGMIIGSIAASVALSMGILTCFAGHAMCIISGIWLILVAVLLFVLEVPSCCGLCGGTNVIAGNLIFKSIAYVILAIVPMGLCCSLGTCAACCLIMVTGVFYGIAICFGKAPSGSGDQGTGSPRDKQYNAVPMLVRHNK